MTTHGKFTNKINSFNSFNSINSAVNINATVTGDERRQILRWLSPLDPQQRHHAVRTNRFDGVGDWLLETSEFRKWSNSNSESDQAVLFCYGNPGVGKTHLSSLVIDYLCDQAEGKDIAVAGLYCDFKDQQEQSASSMLGAILKQLVNRGETPEHVQQAFQKAKKEFGGRSLRLPDLVDILKKTIALLPQVFICLDALDESAPRTQLELFRSLQNIIRESPSTRVFLTGRPHIRKEIEKRFSQAVMIPISPFQQDIQIFLETSLDRDPEPDAMDDNLRTDIMRTIPTTISAM
ncbi:hypothetical protein L873DRAFT_1804510 [Choiromyces venosus 120613-1]|uniref:Nephrocystin 3-like N-terminal domain-containing protein n=1 Tax=Choiromyces venosus 120613-1 TaxID=1336337 RepID=A0A3N4JUB2_9PEZI|nr:hypothetical protein L873DRAFT_1804510 [Choiromyces venosus 120613-1]